MDSGRDGNFCLVCRDHNKKALANDVERWRINYVGIYLGADHCRRCMGESSNHPTPKRHGCQRARAYRRLVVSNKVSNNAWIQTKLHRVLLRAQVARIGQASNKIGIKRKKFRDQSHSPIEWMIQTKTKSKVLRRVSPQHIQAPTESQVCHQTSTTRWALIWTWGNETENPTFSNCCPHVLKAKFPKRWGDWRGGISMIHCSRVSRRTSNLSTDFFCDWDVRTKYVARIIPDCGDLGSRVEKFLPQTRLDDVRIRYNLDSFA